MFDPRMIEVVREQQQARLAEASKQRLIRSLADPDSDRRRIYIRLRLAIGHWLVTLGQRLLAQAIPQPAEGSLTATTNCPCC